MTDAKEPKSTVPEDYMSDGPWQEVSVDALADAGKLVEKLLQRSTSTVAVTAKRTRSAFKDPSDPANWGDGPWRNEPNRVEFRFLGYPCLVNRGPMGSFCGYVGVYADHPWYQRHYDNVEASVHGGLTYGGECQGLICHVPLPEDPGVNVWWVGFDTAHCFDLVPGLRVNMPRRLSGRDHDVYRDLPYLMREVKRLAIQAKRAATVKGRFLIHWNKIEYALRNAPWKIRNAVREAFRVGSEFRIPGITEEMEFGMQLRMKKRRQGD